MPTELTLELVLVPTYVPRPAWAPLLAAALNIGGVGVLVCSFLAYTFRQRTEAAEALAHEHSRSEALLLNVLPKVIAERLKHSPAVIADRFAQATILFADVVGFTPLAASMKSEELVGLLDQLFSAFDDLAERYGVEKIKTIGDAYMVAGGVPIPRPDAAHATADLALAMVQAAARVAPELGLRIGIHIGPIVAGVIGKKKFAYDLWGDTVNTASRMESHSMSGRIQVSSALREHLGNAFVFTSRGAVVVKGLGAMETFFLEGRAPIP